MENKLEQTLKQIKSILDFDIVRRMFFLSGIAISVVVGSGLYHWTQEPIFRPLDIQITDKNLSTIIDTLEKGNIPYKLNDSSDLVSVPAASITTARIKLSSAGIMRNEGASFSFLNDKSKLGSSQFLETARYLRALEEDLSKTIGSLQGISSAQVHIAKPQSNIFADENVKTTASVVLMIVPGFEGDKEKIRAIIQLVAASVPELDPSSVAITDQYGHYLSTAADSQYLNNQEQLNYQNTLEHNYEKRIHMLISPVVGDNRARISVNADVNFTRQEESREAFEPDQKIIRSEQSVQESNSSGSGSGVPGSLSNQPPSNTPQQNSQGGQSRNETVKNYEVSKSTSYTRAETPKINRISVAIVLDNDMVYDEKLKKMTSKPLEKDKMDKISELVKSSIGFKADRGDVVTVINSSFVLPKAIEEKAVALWEEPWFWDLIKKFTGILLGFVFLFIIYRKISPELFRRKAGAQPLASTIEDTKNLISAEMIKLKNEQITILKELVTNDPNKVVGVIKKWVAK